MSHDLPQGLLTFAGERGKCRVGGDRGLVKVLAEAKDGHAAGDEVGIWGTDESVLFWTGVREGKFLSLVLFFLCVCVLREKGI